ncbi:MAG: hypothetical protein ACNS60_11980 [Candidatus Cyclobacteriaceae bacterium M2_1C_046]
MEKTIFENEYVKCVLDESIPVLKHRWLKEPPGFEFKKNLKLILSEYDEIEGNYDNLMWLADTKELGEISEEVEEWLNEEWDNKLFKESNVKVHAVILGEDIFADYPMEKFKIVAEEKFKTQGIKLGLFSEENEAYDWLKSKKPVVRNF